VGLRTFDAEQDGLDLRGEDVHAADDQHVIRSAADAFHTADRAAAGTLVAYSREMSRVRKRMTGHPLLRDRRQDQFAFLAVALDGFQSLGVNDLGIEMVLKDMEAAVRLTFGGDAGADDLGQAVDIKRGHAHPLARSSPHFLRPRLGSEDALFELRLSEVETHLRGHFDQVRQ